MAAVTVTAAQVAPVEIIEQASGPANVDLTAGEVVTYDGTTGEWAKAGAASAAAAGNRRGIALNTAKANEAVTVLVKGIIDIGKGALDGNNYGAAIYLSNTVGGLDTAAGTVSVIVGVVSPAFGSASATDRLLRIDG